MLPVEWQDIGAFLFFALAFLIPSGYSYGAALLVVGSLIVIRRADWMILSRFQWLLVVTFCLYAMVWSFDGFFRGEGLRDMDRPIRFVLAALVMVALARRPVSPKYVIAGLIVGGFGAGIIALYDFVWLEKTRASGFMPTNSFGMLAALYTGLCLCISQSQRGSRPRRRLIMRLTLLAGIMSAVAAILSGSKGAWLVLLGIGGYLAYKEIKSHRSTLIKIAVLVLSASLLLFTYFIPQLPVKDRLDSAAEATIAYVEDDARVDGSISPRLDMWKGGVLLFFEKPILGWGDRGYQEELERLADDGIIGDDRASGRHLHNQYIHVFTTKGLFGGFLLISVFLVLFLLSSRSAGGIGVYSDINPALLNYKCFLKVLLLGFIFGGLTRVPFEHHSGVMVFTFTVAIACNLIEGTSLNPPNEVASWKL